MHDPNDKPIPRGSIEADPNEPLAALDLVVHPSKREARFKGIAVTLRPKSYDLLFFLMRNQGVVVSKEEIIDAIWEGRAVSDDVVSASIRDIRRALDETAAESHYIKTLPRAGYMFVPAIGAAKPDTLEDASAVPTGPKRGVFLLILLLLSVAIIWVYDTVLEEPGSIRSGLAHIATDQHQDARVEATDEFEWIWSSVRNQSLRSNWFAPALADATFVLRLVSNASNPSDSVMVDWRHQGSDEVLGQTLIKRRSNNNDIFANQIVRAVEHTLRCLQEVSEMASTGLQGDTVLLQMMVRLCDASREAGSQATLHLITDQIRTAYPNEAEFQALHLLMLTTQLRHFIQGRQDTKEAALEREIESLTQVLQANPKKGPTTNLSLELVKAYQRGPTDVFEVVRYISSDRWISLRTLDTLATLYRFSGRPSEAQSLVRRSRPIWPAAEYLGLLEILTAMMAGGLDRAQPLFDEAYQGQVARSIDQQRDLGVMLYGREEETKAINLSRLPPSLGACVSQFLALRFEGGAASLEPVCGSLDVTLKMRMLAVLGRRDEVLRLVNRINEDAIGPAFNLHYPEFRPFWKTPEIWEQAERLGMVDMWRSTNTEPDFCADQSIRPLCQRYLGGE